MSEVLRLSFRRSSFLSSGVWRIATEFPAELAPEVAQHAARVCSSDPKSSWRIETTGGRPVPVEVSGPSDDATLRAEIARLHARLDQIKAVVNG